MEVLVDTSIWIDYFRCGDSSKDMDTLIDENIILTNDIILAELIPYLKIKKQTKVVKLLHEVNLVPLSIHWEEIIEFQVKCLNAVSLRCTVYRMASYAGVMHSLSKLASVIKRCLKSIL